MSQAQKRARERKQSPETTEAPARNSAPGDTAELLEEIDSVLEENAEEFVRNYRQKGGQ